jgi:hypothetical protein
MRKVWRLGLGVSLATALCGAPLAAQGWGMRRMEVSLTRKIPSAVSLTGITKVRLEAKSQGQVPPQVADIFRSRLQAEMFKDSRLVDERTSPDLVVEGAITGFSLGTKNVQRSTFDPVAKRNNVYYDHLVSGQVSVSYRAIGARDKKALDSGNFRFGFEQEFLPNGDPYREWFRKGKNEVFKKLPGNDEAYQFLVDGIVREVTKRLVPVDETISVPMARGKLEPASKLGQAARWGAMLEAVEKMPAFPSAEDEAFRQYSIALANEALAYQETDRGRIEEMLAKAALGYKKALQGKPGEEVFEQAQNRMASYSGPAETAAPTATTGDALDRSAAAAPAQPGSLTNADLIRFAQEKFSDDFILEAVTAAEHPAFDLSTDSLIELKRAGVSERVIKALRDRMAKAKPAPKPPKH